MTYWTYQQGQSGDPFWDRELHTWSGCKPLAVRKCEEFPTTPPEWHEWADGRDDAKHRPLRPKELLDLIHQMLEAEGPEKEHLARRVDMEMQIKQTFQRSLEDAAFHTLRAKWEILDAGSSLVRYVIEGTEDDALKRAIKRKGWYRRQEGE